MFQGLQREGQHRLGEEPVAGRFHRIKVATDFIHLMVDAGMALNVRFLWQQIRACYRDRWKRTEIGKCVATFSRRP
jgi:hypothetical protein